ncbi:hypothetical protein DSO57_1038506 [Entomophthora muscae]|uniref:Uncharacterized protein n=1 Tax=Entomophthora muscae TaxID=34485 RepID=A0ACC2TWL5_9FUNG|nr:hypothetical protein DSO57_1038506 [Entomophthora muscae]
MLSASSDSTIKLWSLASQRCVKTYTMHSDPVWCLFSPDPELRHFYAGGRSGIVTKTLVGDLIDNHQRTLSHDSDENEDVIQDDYDDDTNTVVVCREQAGITSITATHDHLHMWTAMPCAHIHRWEDVPPSSLPDPAFALNPDDEEPVRPVRSSAAEVLLGTAGLIKCHILADRRHVLSLDSDGQVAMWDIVRGHLIERLGKVSLEETFVARNPAVVIPNWCSVDTKIGVLSVRLDLTNCFDAEVYQDELGLPEAVPDALVNLGRWVLRSLFAPIIRIQAKSPTFIPAPAKEPLPAKPLAPPQPAATLPPPAIPFQPQLTSPTSPPSRATPEESIPPPQPALAAPSSGFMGRLRQFSVRKLNRSPDQPKPGMSLSSRAPISPTQPSPSTQLSPTPESVSSASSSEQEEIPNSPSQPNDSAFSTPPASNGRSMTSPVTLAAPTIPELDFPHHIILQLSEESGDVSTCIDIYSGTLGSQADEATKIIPLLPAWITDCIFRNIIPSKDVVKIGFQFKPHESSGLSLPTLNSRLLAIRTLRCKKLATFLWEKLNYTPDMLLALLNRRQAAAAAAASLSSATATSNQKGNAGCPNENTPSATLPPFIPEHWIVLMCNDQVLCFKTSLTCRSSTAT